jgi:hypothetical protein
VRAHPHHFRSALKEKLLSGKDVGMVDVPCVVRSMQRVEQKLGHLSAPERAPSLMESDTPVTDFVKWMTGWE